MTKIKTLITVFVLLVGVFALMYFLAKPNTDTGLANLPPVTERDITKGNTQDSVVLLEYSDFQCPACRAFYPVVKDTLQKNNQVKFIYRHFPLSQHPNAKPAAYAAEAAGKQGKFWEMHDKIFEGQNNWSVSPKSDEMFLSYAESLGLDINKFKSDRDSDEIKDKINNDYKGGIGTGVNSTPTFYLNGKKLSFSTFGDLTRLVEEEIKAKGL